MQNLADQESSDHYHWEILASGCLQLVMQSTVPALMHRNVKINMVKAKNENKRKGMLEEKNLKQREIDFRMKLRTYKSQLK